MVNVVGDDRRKLVILAAVGLLLALGIAVALNSFAVVRYRADIYLRWYASEKLLTEGRCLYDARNALEVTTFVHGSPRQTNYFYPAHMLLFTAPLALLPYRVAHLSWTVIGQILYLVGLWLLARSLGWPRSLNGLTLFFVAAVLFIPYLQHTIWAQFNTIGLLSLVLCYLALRSHRYGLAGVLAVGLTFKPHATVLALAFLLIWVSCERARWRFYLGFVVAGILCWVVAEALQPGWVWHFVSSLSGYRTARSVLDLVWNPYQIVAGALCLGVVFLWIKNRHSPPQSPIFAACLALSLAAWLLVMPAIGTMQVVLLPAAFLLLSWALAERARHLYLYACYGAIVIYVLGGIGFLWGLLALESNMDHISWAQLAYEVVGSSWITLFSVLLCWRASSDRQGQEG